MAFNKKNTEWSGRRKADHSGEKGALLRVIVLAALVAFSPAHAADEVIQGDRHSIQVIDGDTIQVGDTVVQLAGIDAPELGQLCLQNGDIRKCGLAAGLELRKIITLSAPFSLKCMPVGENGGVVIGVCLLDYEDVSISMLRSGNAAVVPRDGAGYLAQSASFYLEAERDARTAHLGIWGAEFVAPWRWRAGERAPFEAKHDSCVIKGVVRGAERQYLVPFDESDDGIKVVPPARMFCSDEDARAAGWRRPGEVPVR